MAKKMKQWCPVCEKWRDSHFSYDGLLIHERDDYPPGILYFLNDNYIGTPKTKMNKKRVD